MLQSILRLFSRSSKRPSKSTPNLRKPRNRVGLLECLEDRSVPAGSLVAAADAGAPPEVRIFDYNTGALTSQFLAYDGSIFSGVRVAVGDVNGDGVDDLITAPGPGAPSHIKAFDGRNGNILTTFYAYDPAFTGGVFLASGDVDGDGRDEIITGVGPGGGPQIKATRLNGTLAANFYAYSPNFSGGVRVGAGDLDGDGKAEIITGVGFGGSPHVQAFDVSVGTPVSVASFYAYSSAMSSGVFVAGGDTDGDGRAEIITGIGPGGSPHVKIFELSGANVGSFYAFGPSFQGGVRVDAADVNNDGRAEIIAGTGYGTQPIINTFTGAGALITSNAAFPSDIRIGIYVGMSESPLIIPSTPSEVISAAYQNLRNYVIANRPIIFIGQDPAYYDYYPFYGFGFAAAFPIFYDAPGLFYSPDYFYDPYFFEDAIYFDPGYTDYYYDPGYEYGFDYYYDPGSYYYDPGYYDDYYFDGGFYDDGFFF